MCIVNVYAPPLVGQIGSGLRLGSMNPSERFLWIFHRHEINKFIGNGWLSFVLRGVLLLVFLIYIQS